MSKEVMLLPSSGMRRDAIKGFCAMVNRSAVEEYWLLSSAETKKEGEEQEFQTSCKT
jgi:hypothetical protein